MTCKISLFKSIRETLKHHIASIFAASIVFFVQFLNFFLRIQNLSQEYEYHTTSNWLEEELLNMTLPGYGYMIPVLFVAILLAFDFFRYLHSKKQIDFYESLPIRRSNWFRLRTSSACIVFLLPFTICLCLEMFVLAIFGFATPSLICNLLWNYASMILIFLITWLTAALAMVMTGHSVIAFFGFCVFSIYAPYILRYLCSSYASIHFKTYVSGEENLLQYLNYLSPVGASINLLGNAYTTWDAATHVKDFVILLVLICLLGLLTYLLFLKRPSESAGRAMAFEKANPIIRILLVIPLALYLGLYLSLVASVGAKIWMVLGFIIGTVLLHGIIESIFQFDIRGMWSHKKQMLGCFLACLGFACIFWFDLLKYDDYLPELDELESIVLETNNDYFYYDDSMEKDGITGEYLDDALLLAQNIVEQDADINTNMDLVWIRFEYRLKNGSVKRRDYYMDFEANQELFDKLYATKDYKNDICPLYNEDWSDIQYIDWNDSVSTQSLYLSNSELAHVLETYLAEYTKLTYSQAIERASLGEIMIHFGSESYRDYSCPVDANFTQTIALLESYLNGDDGEDYGSITESPLVKYEIYSLNIYAEKGYISITDKDVIDSVKNEFILSDYFYKNYDWTENSDYYDAEVTFITDTGLSYLSVIIPKDIAESIMN